MNLTKTAMKTPDTVRPVSGSHHLKTEAPPSSFSTPEYILNLQRSIGNRAAQRLLKSGAFRAKLTIGQPNDVYEQEADKVADLVMTMRESSAVNDASLPSTREGGEPLGKSERAFFEPCFGHNFTGVRLHNGTRAMQLARAVNAQAFTVGQDIFFGAGAYVPASSAGRRLIAHELAHVVQQSGGTQGLSRSPTVVQRRVGDGHDLSSPWLAGDAQLEGAFDNEAGRFLRRGSRGTSVKRVQQLLYFLGFDIGRRGADGIFGPDTDAAVRAFQRRYAPPVDGIIGPITIGALDAQANSPEPNRTTPQPVPAGPPTGTPPSVSVDRIDLVTGAAGAIGGFPPIVGGASLNTPGPFNSPTEVKNSLQVHFHVDNGSSADLTPVREIQRTATTAAGMVSNNPPDEVLPPGVAGPTRPGGFTGVLIGNDGPAAHEIMRPDAHTIVVADAPGLSGMVTASYPVTYMAHFILTMRDPRNAPIARINFDVRIDKRSENEVPNTENRAFFTAKRDFVRGRNL